MKKDTVYVTMSDGSSVAVHRWIPDAEPRALVQISHGMAEYAMRYDRLGQMLCENGIVMYAHDHRGHGDTAGSVENLGFLADEEGFQQVISDLREVIARLKSDFPGKKTILLGHSFGSFVTQGFIEQFGGDIDACIISGTAGPRLPLVFTARIIAETVMFFRGPKYRSPFLQNLAFGSYNKRIENPSGPNDWLSRDAEEVKKYEESEYCGFLPTASFFRDLFTGLFRIHRKKAMASIRKDLPVFIFAGTGDPVGDYGKTVERLADIYKRNGMQDVTLILYPDARHETLNETNRDEVSANVLSWINEHVQ